MTQLSPEFVNEQLAAMVIDQTAEEPHGNPLRMRLWELQATRGIHLLNNYVGREQTSLLIADVIADTDMLGVPGTVKQSIIMWGDQVQHFFFDATAEGSGQAYMEASRHFLSEGAVVEHPDMPPLYRESELRMGGIMLHIGSRYKEHVRTRAMHLDLVESAEAARQFLGSTEQFVKSTTTSRRTLSQLNTHTH